MRANRSIYPILVASLIGIVGSIIAKLVFPFLEEYIPIIVTMIIILAGMGVILHSKVNEINDNQIELEEKINRAESLIEIRAENKYLKDKIIKIEEMIKNGS